MIKLFCALTLLLNEDRLSIFSIIKIHIYYIVFRILYKQRGIGAIYSLSKVNRLRTVQGRHADVRHICLFGCCGSDICWNHVHSKSGFIDLQKN